MIGARATTRHSGNAVERQYFTVCAYDGEIVTLVDEKDGGLCRMHMTQLRLLRPEMPVSNTPSTVDEPAVKQAIAELSRDARSAVIVDRAAVDALEMTNYEIASLREWLARSDQECIDRGLKIIEQSERIAALEKVIAHRDAEDARIRDSFAVLGESSLDHKIDKHREALRMIVEPIIDMQAKMQRASGLANTVKTVIISKTFAERIGLTGMVTIGLVRIAPGTVP